jgi:glucose/arabinose dehydrogenase
VKNFLIRILLAAALTLVAFALVSSAQAQQADEDPAPATPRQQQPAETPKSPRQPQVPAPSGDAQTNDAQTQQALAFTGRIANEEGKLVLKDPVTKMSYQLNDQTKAKPYFGKQVKVVGKLDMKSNTIHVDTIEPI